MLKQKDFKKHFPTKGYLHIDRRIPFERVKDYVMDPHEISTHSFLPLIHYIAKNERYIGYQHSSLGNRPFKTKKRKIMYAGHFDSYVYKYYSILLNNVFNSYSVKIGIDECVTAYRDNKKGLSNIDFAAEVINKIVAYENAFIYLGDFTEFFDRIDHKQLKYNLQKVSKSSWLSDDWYNVFRSLTKYGYYHKVELNECYGSDNEIRRAGKYSYFKNLKEFRDYKSEHKPCYNSSLYGIPQGTALSGVFANVYCVDFDRKMNSIAKRYNGIYRRYSDDFILVIPKRKLLSKAEIIQNVEDSAKIYNLDLQKEKTETLIYKKENIYDYESNHKTHLDYLGFILEGIQVKVRSKSIYKFYRKASKLIKKAKRVKMKKDLDKLPYRKQIYRMYTDMGAGKKPYGNFITYIKNSQRIFDNVSPYTNNLMLDQIKNRKRKIEQMLGYRIHTRI